MPRIMWDDTGDLPAGWSVDHDNWGYRAMKPTDDERVALLLHADSAPAARLGPSAFRENGRVYVMRAEVARYLDSGSIE